MRKTALFIAGMLASLAACGSPGPAPGAPEKAGIDAQGKPLRLGEASVVAGTPLLTLKIGAIEGDPYSSYSGGDDRNVMILDPRNGSSRKVLQTNDRQLAQWLVLGDDTATFDASRYPHRADDKSLSTHYVAVVEARAERGQERRRRYDVLLGSFADGRQVWIAEGVDGLIHARKLQAGSILMIMAERGRTFVRYFAPDSLVLQRTTELKV